MDKEKLSECKEFVDIAISRVNFWSEKFKKVYDDYNSRMHTIKLKRDPKNKTINIIVRDDINHGYDTLSKHDAIGNDGFMCEYCIYERSLDKLGDSNEINSNDGIISYCKEHIIDYNPELTVTDNLKALWKKLLNEIEFYSDTYMIKTGTLQNNTHKIIMSYEFSGYTVYVDGGEYNYYGIRRRIAMNMKEKLEHLEETIKNKLLKEEKL